MSMFYDSKKRKTQPWVGVFFILAPLLLIFIVWFTTRGLVKENKDKQQVEEEKDIFDEF